jgi:hypothetical protein
VTFAIIALVAAALPIMLFATVAPPGTPETLVVATPRGESRLVVRADSSAGPAVSAAQLLSALRGSARADGSWMELTIGGLPFRFLLGAPVFLLNDRLEPLAGLVYEANDSLFLPFQFVAEILPQVFTGFYRYDAAQGAPRGYRAT